MAKNIRANITTSITADITESTTPNSIFSVSIGNSTLVKTYFILLVLTIVSAFLGEFSLTQEIIINFNLPHEIQTILLGVLLSIAMIKGILIIDVFMELKNAPTFWRKLFLSYVILVPTIVFFIYFLF